jgi:hypothetical protein
MRNCYQCGLSVHILNIQHCYESDRHNRPTIWLCSELCHSRQQCDLYQAHIRPDRANPCVVIQTHEPALHGKGLVLSRGDWMQQPFNELSGCRLLARWFPHRQYSSYCKRSSVKFEHGTSNLISLPTDAVRNILMGDSFHAMSQVVVLPQAGTRGNALVSLE